MVELVITPQDLNQTGLPRQDPPHEHGWCVESSHPTSIGRVLYVRCIVCGTRRVDLEARDQDAPAAISKEAQDQFRGGATKIG